MGKRTRIINDPSDLVPLLRAFGSKTHKKVFDKLSKEWMTKQELMDSIGNETKEGTIVNVERSLEILRKSGLIESKWRMPEPGKTPDKEFHTSYSKVHVAFQCSIEDFSDLIMLTFKSDDELRGLIERMEQEVASGNQSLAGLARTFDKTPIFIRSAARRSDRLVVKGARLELIEEKE
ncbi:MAG: ArsR family transcriptional regulator [Methanosarcinales archaeon]